MPKTPPKKRRQTEQVNVRLTSDQLQALERAVEKLRAGAGPGARYSLSGLLLDAGLAEAKKITGGK